MSQNPQESFSRSEGVTAEPKTYNVKVIGDLGRIR